MLFFYKTVHGEEPAHFIHWTWVVREPELERPRNRSDTKTSIFLMYEYIKFTLPQNQGSK